MPCWRYLLLSLLAYSTSHGELTRIFAANSGLVAEGGHPGAAVAVAHGVVQVDRESVHTRAHTIVVVPLRPAEKRGQED